MVGHNADEVRNPLFSITFVPKLNTFQGLLFTSPFVSNNSAFETYVETSLPTVRAWPSVLNYIANTLYPPIFDGSQAMGYTNQIARAAAVTSELIFT